jgi:predicted nucleic acid-binding protein
VITLDTSGLFALLNRRDPDHDAARTSLAEDRGPCIVPAGILAEIAYLIEERLGSEPLDLFLADLQAGAFTLDCGEDDIPRIRELVTRYGDLPLGFADAATIACAERSGGRVLTFDRRDFAAVAREGRIEIVPGW